MRQLREGRTNKQSSKIGTPTPQKYTVGKGNQWVYAEERRPRPWRFPMLEQQKLRERDTGETPQHAFHSRAHCSLAIVG